MADSGNTPAPIHDPPSLPTSPLPKRTKVIEPLANSSLSSAIDTTRTATPTPAVVSTAASLAAVTRPSIINGTSTHSSTMAADVPALQVKLLSEKGKAPTKGSAFAAGYDIYSAHDTVVPAKGKALVDTDIAIAVPAGTYGRVAPRSGLAVKHSITTGAGVIDADYRGQVKVLLFNLGDADFEVKHGDRIAQLVLERIVTPEVAVVEELEESVRGAGGFGSTGGFGNQEASGIV